MALGVSYVFLKYAVAESFHSSRKGPFLKRGWENAKV